jgi:hypothetical protein
MRVMVRRNSPAGFPQLYLLDPDRNIIEINGAAQPAPSHPSRTRVVKAFCSRGQSLLTTNSETVGERNRFRPDVRVDLLDQHPWCAMKRARYSSGRKISHPVAVAPTGSSRRGHCW